MKSIESIVKTAKSIGAFDSINYGVYFPVARNFVAQMSIQVNTIYGPLTCLFWNHLRQNQGDTRNGVVSNQRTSSSKSET